MLDANGNTSYLSCNERGLQISHTKAARTAEEQTSTQVWHETLNLPVAIHEPGRSTYYSYDNNGNVLEKRGLDTATNVQGFELPAPNWKRQERFPGLWWAAFE
jgi:YD repeat-containing protein